MWCMWCFCESNDIAIVKYAGHKSKHKSESYSSLTQGLQLKTPGKMQFKQKQGVLLVHIKEKKIREW